MKEVTRGHRAAKKQALAVCALKVRRRGGRTQKIIVATCKVRTMAEKGANEIGHAEDLMLHKCDVIGLQQARYIAEDMAPGMRA